MSGNDNNKKKTVLFKVSFLKIGEIDTLKETFSADVYVQAKWREPNLDSKPDIDQKSQWSPKLVIQNILTETKHATWRVIDKDETGAIYVNEKHRIKGIFSESLELALFPYDIQDISILLTTELSEDEVEFIEDDNELSSVHLEAFGKQQEWDLREFVEFQQKVTTKEYANSKYKNPGIVARCCAGRKAGFFLWNVLLIMTLISSLSFCTFSVDKGKPQNRLQLSFTLVLTGVAFKFVANQAIPKISYLTQLDRYILGSMVFLYLVCAWHAIVTLIVDNDAGHVADRWAFITFCILFTVFHIAFIISVFISGYRRLSHVNYLESQYHEKARKLMGEDFLNTNQRKKSIKYRSPKVTSQPV